MHSDWEIDYNEAHSRLELQTPSGGVHLSIQCPIEGLTWLGTGDYIGHGLGVYQEPDTQSWDLTLGSGPDSIPGPASYGSGLRVRLPEAAGLRLALLLHRHGGLLDEAPLPDLVPQDSDEFIAAER